MLIRVLASYSVLFLPSKSGSTAKSTIVARGPPSLLVRRMVALLHSHVMLQELYVILNFNTRAHVIEIQIIPIYVGMRRT